METLKPKHLSNYLPYSLKVIMEGEKTNVAWMSTKNIAVIIPDGIGKYKKIPWKRAHLNVQPILRPLSDLNKNSSIFLSHKLHINISAELNGKGLDVYKISYNDAELLFKNHYDVFGLIDKGLAIDINTILT